MPVNYVGIWWFSLIPLPPEPFLREEHGLVGWMLDSQTTTGLYTLKIKTPRGSWGK